jgi:hypothetical protein
MNAATLQVKDNAIPPRLYLAMELSNQQGRLVFGEGVKRRRPEHLDGAVSGRFENV